MKVVFFSPKLEVDNASPINGIRKFLDRWCSGATCLKYRDEESSKLKTLDPEEFLNDFFLEWKNSFTWDSLRRPPQIIYFNSLHARLIDLGLEGEFRAIIPHAFFENAWELPEGFQVEDEILHQTDIYDEICFFRPSIRAI